LFRGRQITLAVRGGCLVEKRLKVHGRQIAEAGTAVMARLVAQHAPFCKFNLRCPTERLRQ
jgi:hypothetical protein